VANGKSTDDGSEVKWLKYTDGNNPHPRNRNLNVLTSSSKDVSNEITECMSKSKKWSFKKSTGAELWLSGGQESFSLLRCQLYCGYRKSGHF